MMPWSLLWVPLVLAHDDPSCEKLLANWTDSGALQGDIHDKGDSKQFSVKKHTLHVLPFDNHTTWEVKAKIDTSICAAVLDFNVPGKRQPPPVPLEAQFLHMKAYSASAHLRVTRMVTEFTDPSGTLKPPGYPLNHLVSNVRREENNYRKCPKLSAVFADIVVGDEKRVTVSRNRVTIRSTKRTKDKLFVQAKLDPKTCQAVVDQKVTMSFWHAVRLTEYENPNAKYKTVVSFTDSRYQHPYAPINHWVELKDGFDPYVPPVATGKCCYGFPGKNNWEGCSSATACPANPSCETKGLCEGICRGTWCNTGTEDLVV